MNERAPERPGAVAPGPAPGGAPLGRTEAWTVGALIALGAALRVAYAFHHTVNVDEPQHLHVAWSWTQGLLPYRDVFDNHSPLVGLLFAPVLAAFGPRADIVILMRLAMAPVAALTLWAVWILVRRLSDARAAWWAVAVTGVQPDFIERGVEFRTDVPWMALWLSTLAVLLAPRLGARRAFAGGLLLGATFMASMKTSLLTACLALAAAGTLAVSWEAGRVMGRRVAGVAGALAAGAVVVPAVVAAFFALHHAWSPFVFSLVAYNYVPTLGRWDSAWLPFLAIPAIPLLLWGARRLVRSAPGTPIGRSRSVLFLTAAFYWVAVETTWPLVTRQDWLPLVPMVAATFVPIILEGIDRRRARAPRAPAWARTAWIAPALIASCEIVMVVMKDPVWKDNTVVQREILGEVLQLTRPSEPVLDARGEAIFRTRPTYAIFEAVAHARIRSGLMRDDVAQRAEATRAMVAFGDIGEWPPGAREFLHRNYVPVGFWRVAGRILTRPSGSAPCEFDVVIPDRYTIVGPAGPGHGLLDGTPFTGARVLSAGRHTYAPSAGEEPVAVIWALAIERGFMPLWGLKDVTPPEPGQI